MNATTTQVLVVGGGPAGSTTATLLARQGFNVCLLEREAMPRYHVGESLLPSCLRIFDLLGVREKVEKHGFQRKDGVYYDWGGQEWAIEFGSLTKSNYGFQVIRSEFDWLLLEHAKSEGVQVSEQTEVEEVFFEHGRPVAATATDKAGNSKRVSFEFLVDASGRAGLMATRYLHSRQFHEAFRNVAVWGYWQNAKRLPVGPVGAIATCSILFGWIWAIPLHDGTLSVGLVLHRSKLKELRKDFTLEEIYRQAVGSCQVVAGLTDGASLETPLRTESDYSYAADQFSGPGYCLVGDAACFLDPLLSTGVHLAMLSALVAAASIASTLRGEVEAAEASQFYNDSYRRAYLRMMVVVSSFYQTHKGRDSYFREAQQLTSNDYSHAELRQAFLHVISGVEDLEEVESMHPEALIKGIAKLYEEHYSFIREKVNWRSLPLEEMQKGVKRSKIVITVQEDFSLTEDTAINGLYVATEPRLGLRRAPAASLSGGGRENESP